MGLRNIQPHNFFLCAALFFGILYSIIIPPFQVPDEPNHFYRAWQSAEGKLISIKIGNRVGGFLPSTVKNMGHSYDEIHYANKKYVHALPFELLKIPLSDEYEFVDYHNTAMYSP